LLEARRLSCARLVGFYHLIHDAGWQVINAGKSHPRSYVNFNLPVELVGSFHQPGRKSPRPEYPSSHFDDPEW
jgi:hypothetical protein